MAGRADPFALDDVSGGHDTLAALPPGATEALSARVLYGIAPLCAAAELARRGDRRYARALVGAAAFLDAEDVLVLATLPGGPDALAGLLLAPGLQAPLRVAAAGALTHAQPTPAALAALAETADGPRRVQGAGSALTELSLRAGAALQEEAERLRTVGRHVRDRVRGTLRRQELQRAVASASLHPAVAWLAGDVDFLAGLLPPVADAAREPLVPHLLAAARGGDDALRARVAGLLHRRWRDVAGTALACIARTPLKGRDAALGPWMVAALGTMGAVEDLVAVAGAASGVVRAAAVTELARVPGRQRAELDPAVLAAALARASADPDPGVAVALAALAARGGTGV